jgi:GNAT superfamily N-acetyltransferase
MRPDLYAALEATWPPARAVRLGPWTIRDGRGGGKRVSAATAEGDWTEADLAPAEAAMRALGQVPLFLVRDEDARLDAALEGHGYALVAPTLFYEVPVASLAPYPDAMTGFAHWPPLAIVNEIWSAAGIGPARQAVMARVSGPHAAILGRTRDRPSGAAFVAVSGGLAMIHALEVPEVLRRQGTARNLLGRAAHWAAGQGAERLALAVTEANAAARALYASLGMQVVGRYHYREADAP